MKTLVLNVFDDSKLHLLAGLVRKQPEPKGSTEVSWSFCSKFW
uniref:Uncharacterized protein n=1 Tax=Candidatus Kentrum sp. DK TaxID=2126562 RepID=A0A450RYA1_9GAMM|nr:MAG: hypothetical protein BECKDK2373C_GA0170839_100762 [Candidatus Kentron sp. DK]